MMIAALLTALSLQTAPPLAAPAPARSDSIDVAAQRGEVEAGAALDRMHRAEAQADGATYFAQFASDARFIGTDASEHWDLAAFKAYAEPLFARGRGWSYRPHDRTLILAGDFAWFDEQLDNDSYGALRGSGLLRRTGPGETWKIQQYVLSFTVPNDKAEAVVRLIAANPAD